MNGAQIKISGYVLSLLLPATAIGQQPEFRLIDPGLGRFQVGTSTLDVQETLLGHHVTYVLTNPLEVEGSPTLRFLASWRSPKWTQLTIELHEPDPPGAFAVRFEPYDDGEQEIVAGRTFMLQPNRIYGISTRQSDFCLSCGPNRFNFEYSLETAAAPLAADFNFDGRVNLFDFLILAGNYNRRDTFWTRGDANLDGDVNFLDFMTLRQNYGARRVANASVAIPEPDQWPLIRCFVLAAIGHCSRRRRHG